MHMKNRIFFQREAKTDEKPILCKFTLGLYGVSNTRVWSPEGRPWPRGHILKSLASKVKFLALASSFRKLPCPRLEDSTSF